MILSCLDEDEVSNNEVGYSSEFEFFWKTFPSSDRYLHWPETRKLRTSKKDTYKAYLHALKTVSSDKLLSALNQDIDNRRSSVGKDNPFKFMKGSFRWLEDQMFNEVEVPETVKFANDTLL